MLDDWTQVEINDKPVDVFDPPNGSPAFGILFLHPVGLETLVDNEVYTKLLTEHSLACVCPHTQRSWWTDRICPEFDTEITAEQHVMDHVVPFMRERWNLGPRRIGLLGISMGGQGALRLSFKYPKEFPVVAGISSAVDYHELFGQDTPVDDMYDSKEQCRQDTAIMHVPPHHFPPHIFFCIDPNDVDWYRGNDRLHEKLSALGVPHTMDIETEAGGHSWDYFNHMAATAINFVVSGLQHESRRLL